MTAPILAWSAAFTTTSGMLTILGWPGSASLLAFVSVSAGLTAVAALHAMIGEQ